MKRNSSTGLISDPTVGNNRSLYKTVENMQLELNRSIEKELRGFRNDVTQKSLASTSHKMSHASEK